MKIFDLSFDFLKLKSRKRPTMSTDSEQSTSNSNFNTFEIDPDKTFLCVYEEPSCPSSSKSNCPSKSSRKTPEREPPKQRSKPASSIRKSERVSRYARECMNIVQFLTNLVILAFVLFLIIQSIFIKFIRCFRSSTILNFRQVKKTRAKHENSHTQ